MRLSAILLLCALVVALEAVPVEVYQRNIPVEIRYDDQLVQVLPRDAQARRNLDPKVQLSTDELGEVSKHLPMQEENQGGKKEEKLPELPANAEKSQEEKVKETEIPKEEETPAIKSLIQPEDQENEETAQGKQSEKSIDKVLQETKQIITNGLTNLRNSFKPTKDQPGPSAEQWESLEKAVNEYFDVEKQKLLTRQGTVTDSTVSVAPPGQNQNNWMQNIISGFNGIASNFVQSIQNLGSNGGTPQGQGDEGTGQPPSSGFQGFVQFFNNGISNIVSTISGSNSNGATTSNTNLSDSGATPSPGGPIGFFGTIVSNVQNALGIQQQQGQQPAAGVQGDTGAPTQQQQNGPVQIIQSVGNAISNLFQGNQNRPPNTSGDEGTATAQPGNTNIIQNIQNAIQNSPLNPFRPQGGTSNQNPIQNAIQSVGQQAQQLIPSAEQSQTPQGIKNPVIIAIEEKPLEQPEKPLIENEIIKKEVKTQPLPIA